MEGFQFLMHLLGTAEEILTRSGTEALDFKLFAKFLKEAYGKSLPRSSAAQLKLLHSMNLACGSQLNLAGLLLFGEAPDLCKPQFIVKAISFFGTQIANSYMESEDCAGPFPYIFKQIRSFILRHLRKVQNGRHVNSLGEAEIPPPVFDELLVNALIHRDYFTTAPIRVFIFEDRIEIINPGNLPDHLTIEKIKSGRGMQSDPRNPIFASLAAKGLLPYRGLGKGIRLALKAWPHITFNDDRHKRQFISTVQRPDPPQPPSPKLNVSRRLGSKKAAFWETAT